MLYDGSCPDREGGQESYDHRDTQVPRQAALCRVPRGHQEGGRAGERVPPDHLAFVRDLENRGILFAAGPFLDEATGKPNGSGMFLIRGSSTAEVAAIVGEDPFQKHGFHTFRIQPWQINEGGFGLRVNFSEGTYTLD